MGSFADGMKMGQNAYQSSLDNKRQEEKDARLKVMQGREDAAYNREQTQIKDEDTAVQQYGLLTTQGKRNAAGVQANDADFDMAVQATGQGLPMPAAIPQAPEWSPATDLDKNQGLQGISRARRDWNGVAALQKEEKGLKWDQTFGQRLKEYAGTDEQIGATAVHLNSNSKRVSMGDPDKSGVVRISVIKPDGRADFMKLSRQDQAQLYAAGGMMELDPQRALTIMSGVNKELAAAVAADNGIEFKLAEAADRNAGRIETSRHNRAGESEDSKRTGIAAAGLGLRRQEANRKNSQNLREFVDEKGNTVLLDVTDIKPDAQGRMAIPAGLRPKTARQEISPEDTKEYRTAVLGLGPRPAEKTGVFGGKDDGAGTAWDAQKAQIDSVFGAAAGQPKGGLPAWGSAAPAATQTKPAAPSSAPSRGNTKVISQGAVEPSAFGLGRGLNTYNVQMPDGSTRLVTTDELESMGYNLGQTNGRKAYIPGYEG